MMKKITALSLLAGAAVSSAALASEPVSRDEVRAMVAEMLADAQTRSSLLEGGGVAGYDRGFVVRSPEGDWSLKINGLGQFRYIVNVRDEDNVTPAADPTTTPIPVPPGTVTVAPTVSDFSDDVTHGFQLRKTYLVFSGNAVNRDLRYFIKVQQELDNALNVEDVFFEYFMGRGITLRAGQFKPHFLKEYLNGEAYTLAAERGVMNAFFNQGRSQGISLEYMPNNEWTFFVDFTDGFRSSGTDFNQSRIGGNFQAQTEWAITGRAEWVFRGSKEDLRDYTSKPGSKTSGMLGAALHWQHSAEGPGSLIGSGNPIFPDSELFAWTIDGQIEGGGLGAFVALAGFNTDVDGAAVDGNAYGLTAQGSWRWDEAPEVFVKYDGLFLNDLNAGTALDPENLHFVTFGFINYYADHAAKLTLDVIVSLTENDNVAIQGFTTTGNADVFGTPLGLLGSPNDRFEAGFRAQIQVGF